MTDQRLLNCYFEPPGRLPELGRPVRRDQPRSERSCTVQSADPPADDPLAASLTYLAAYHGRAVSREALLGGLPILDGRLSVALFDRAARRAGLETEAIKRDILDIPALVLPAVLIMKNGTALILLGMDDANESVKVLDPLAKPSSAADRSVSTRSPPTIPATRSWSGPQRKPTRARLPRATCRETTGSGRSSRCTGVAMGTLRLPPS